MTRLESVYDESVKFQLTSSRRGWRRKSKGYIDIRVISTHILTKRMTVQPKKEKRKESFQLTSSRRGWRQKSFLSDLTVYISTHILTKRMTFTCPCTHNITFYFNSHPHEEDDCYRCISLPTWRYFNSHPHEEDDRRVQQAFQCPWYFNSHPHEEDDTIRLTARGYRYYFNSHPHEEDDYTIYLVWHE